MPGSHHGDHGRRHRGDRQRLTHAHKRIDWILQHLLAARSTFSPGTRLLVAGGYAERDEALTAALPDDSADFVRFLGRVEDCELSALYRGAAALLCASVSEGSNLSAQEALASGCPVIATDIPAHRETLGRHANLFPPADGDAFLRLVRSALAAELPRTVRVCTTWRESAGVLIEDLAAILADVKADGARSDPAGRSSVLADR